MSSPEIPIGASVLVKGQLYPELVGEIGTVTNKYGYPEYLAFEVELADNRKGCSGIISWSKRKTKATGGKGKRRPGASWPETLRAVRGWLEPYAMLNRYWRAYSAKLPPPRLRALLARAFSGRGLYLYVN